MHRILLPIDVRRCPLEVLRMAERLSEAADLTVTLLHVLHLNIVVPDDLVYDQMAEEAIFYLERLAAAHPRLGHRRRTRVCIGNPLEQILQEATSDRADLIILSSRAPRFWSRIQALWTPASASGLSALVRRIIERTACGVVVVRASEYVDCEQRWGRPRTADPRTRSEPGWGNDFERPRMRRMGRRGTLETTAVQSNGLRT